MTKKYQYIVTGIENLGWDGGKKVFSKVCELTHPLTVNDHAIIQELIGVSLINNQTGEDFSLTVTPLEDAIVKISNNEDITYQSISFDGVNYNTESKKINILKQNPEDISLLFNKEVSVYQDYLNVFYTNGSSLPNWDFIIKSPETTYNKASILRPEQINGCLNTIAGFDTSINGFFCLSFDNKISKLKSVITYYPDHKKYIINHKDKLELHIVDELTGDINVIIPYTK